MLGVRVGLVQFLVWLPGKVGGECDGRSMFQPAQQADEKTILFFPTTLKIKRFAQTGGAQAGRQGRFSDKEPQ